MISKGTRRTLFCYHGYELNSQCSCLFLAGPNAEFCICFYMEREFVTLKIVDIKRIICTPVTNMLLVMGRCVTRPLDSNIYL